MRPQRAASGFALPAVLIVVGMLALVFLVAVSALDALSRQTAEAKQSVMFEQTALSAEARIAFIAATEPLAEDSVRIGGPRATSRPNGLSAPALLQPQSVTPFYLDGRRYRLSAGRFWLSLKDAAGQINLDQLSPEARVRLVGVLGVAPKQQPVLLDRLADDMDPDDLKRMQGAEAADYAAAGLALPRNRPFSSPAEALGVLGWREMVLRPAWTALRDEIDADPVSAVINVNTASPLVLQVLLGLTPDQAQRAASARSQTPFLSMADLIRTAGPIPYDVERTYTRPNGRFALKVADPRAGLVYRARIVLTPDGLERPLWIEERSLLPASADEKSPPPSDAPAFPDPAH